MDLFERANIAVESLNLTAMDWDQYLTSGQSQGEGSVDGSLLRRIENTSSVYDVTIGPVSPGVSREFTFVAEDEIQESTFIQRGLYR